MSIVVLKYKKLVKELLFAYSELEYVETVLKDAHADFEKYYQEFCSINEVPVGELDQQNSERLEKVFPKKEPQVDEQGLVKIEPPKKESPAHKVFQKMYRMIAKKLHPDKLSTQEQTPEVAEKIESFKQATAAYDKRNWAEFLDVCEKYDILPTRYEKISSVIRDEISETNKLIKTKKMAFSWRLYECEDNKNCKDKTIKDFLLQLFKYKIDI